MQVESLNHINQPAVLAYLRAAPYRNALPLSNVTQLRSRSDVVVASQSETVLGVASTYHDLPLPNLTFVASSGEVLGTLLETLASRNPQLRAAPISALLPLERRNQLGRLVSVQDVRAQYQMAIEPEQLAQRERWPARRLTGADLPALDELAQLVGLRSWNGGALSLGPVYGCFDGDRLVAMAGTHYATGEVIELGYVATHPDYRRRGYASACLSALLRAAFTLAPRAFLMVMDDNAPALALYKHMRFWPVERFYLTRFALG